MSMMQDTSARTRNTGPLIPAHEHNDNSAANDRNRSNEPPEGQTCDDSGNVAENMVWFTILPHDCR